MTKRQLVIATRESPLAICQAEFIRQRLMSLHPHLSVALLGITTEGDKKLEVTLRQIGGKGLFVKELEEALLSRRADIAVHSMKDVPMVLPAGLSLPVITKREDPRDVLVSTHYESLAQLPWGAKLGTASLRRQTQIRALRSDVALVDLRGNIQTRLKKLDQGEFDAIILAGAGLIRMGLSDRIRAYLSPEDCLPAAGQGALGLECREGDEAVMALIAPLADSKTTDCVIAERALCRQLNGGCQIPIAAFAEVRHDRLKLKGLVANRMGTCILRAEQEGMRDEAASMGIRVAESLQAQGAEALLREFYESK